MSVLFAAYMFYMRVACVLRVSAVHSATAVAYRIALLLSHQHHRFHVACITSVQVTSLCQSAFVVDFAIIVDQSS